MAVRKPNQEPAVTAILRHWRDAMPDDRMAHLVKDLWRGLTRAFQVRLGEHAVSFGHWVFLRILWERDGLTLTELSEEAGLMPPTTHSTLKTMERLGYVELRRRPDAGRSVFVHLSPRGRAMKVPLVALAEEVNRIALKGAPDEDVAATRRTLRLMIENLARDELDLLKADRRVPSTRELAGITAPKSGRRPAARARKRSTLPPSA